MKLVLPLFLLTAFPLLAGCASGLPEMIPPDQLPLEVLVQKVECELKGAVGHAAQRHRWFDDWQGVYTLTLKVTETGSVKSNANTFPIAFSGGLLNLGVGGNYTQTAYRTALLKFNIAVKDVALDRPCPKASPDLATKHPFVSGSLGITEWLTRALAVTGAKDGRFADTSSKLSSIGHTFEFTVDRGGGGGPGFVIASGKLSNDFGAVASGERADDEILEVAFSKSDAPLKAVTVTKKTVSSTRVIDEKISSASAEQSRAENRLKDYDEANRSVAPDTDPSGVRARLSEAVTAAKAKKNALQDLRSVGQQSSETTTSVTTSETGSDQILNNTLLQLQLERLVGSGRLQ